MSTRFVCGDSPIYEYPPDVPFPHPVGVCDGRCQVCLAQERARQNGTARIVGTLVWSGTETHNRLRRSFLDWLFGRPGKWVSY